MHFVSETFTLCFVRLTKGSNEIVDFIPLFLSLLLLPAMKAGINSFCPSLDFSESELCFRLYMCFMNHYFSSSYL